MNFAREASDYVAIMNEGTFVEKGKCEEIFEDPKSQVTREFLAADLE